MTCKVLYLPLNYGSSVQTGVYDAFRKLDCQLEIFDYFLHYHNSGSNQRNVRTMLIEVAKRFKPDLVYCQIQHTVIIDADTLNAIRTYCPGVKIVQYTIDCRSYIPGPYFNVSKICDVNFICSTGQLQMYKDNTVANVHYLQTGYDPNLYFPETEVKDSYEFDVVFLANTNNVENYPGSEERFQTAKALRAAFGQKFGLFGHGWPADMKSKGSIEINKAVSDVYSRSFCNISVSHFNNISHYFSDRLLMCMASGRPCISWQFPGWDSYFADKQDLVIANSSSDIVNKVKWLLENKNKANLIGQNGAAKVFSEHTYLSRITEMLEMIGLK
jgi:spore maturation protein CgeB